MLKLIVFSVSMILSQSLAAQSKLDRDVREYVSTLDLELYHHSLGASCRAVLSSISISLEFMREVASGKLDAGNRDVIQAKKDLQTTQDLYDRASAQCKVPSLEQFIANVEARIK